MSDIEPVKITGKKRVCDVCGSEITGLSWHLSECTCCSSCMLKKYPPQYSEEQDKDYSKYIKMVLDKQTGKQR